MERSVYIIKPESFLRREGIRSRISEAGLQIAAIKEAMLPVWALKQLYPDVPVDIWTATLSFMRAGNSELGVVEGADAIQRLLKLAGYAVDPSKCAVGTIRHDFGCMRPIEVGQSLFFLNGFHRSRNISEAISDNQLFGQV